MPTGSLCDYLETAYGCHSPRNPVPQKKRASPALRGPSARGFGGSYKLATYPGASGGRQSQRDGRKGGCALQGKLGQGALLQHQALGQGRLHQTQSVSLLQGQGSQHGAAERGWPSARYWGKTQGRGHRGAAHALGEHRCTAQRGAAWHWVGQGVPPCRGSCGAGFGVPGGFAS